MSFENCHQLLCGEWVVSLQESKLAVTSKHGQQMPVHTFTPEVGRPLCPGPQILGPKSHLFWVIPRKLTGPGP